MNKTLLVLVIMASISPCATAISQLPVHTEQTATAVSHPALRPVPIGWRLFHPFYLGRLRAAKELQELQGGWWVWQPGSYQFVPSQVVPQQ